MSDQDLMNNPAASFQDLSDGDRANLLNFAMKALGPAASTPAGQSRVRGMLADNAGYAGQMMQRAGMRPAYSRDETSSENADVRATQRDDYMQSLLQDNSGGSQSRGSPSEQGNPQRSPSNAKPTGSAKPAGNGAAREANRKGASTPTSRSVEPDNSAPLPPERPASMDRGPGDVSGPTAVAGGAGLTDDPTAGLAAAGGGMYLANLLRKFAGGGSQVGPQGEVLPANVNPRSPAMGTMSVNGEVLPPNSNQLRAPIEDAAYRVMNKALPQQMNKLPAQGGDDLTSLGALTGKMIEGPHARQPRLPRVR